MTVLEANRLQFTIMQLERPAILHAAANMWLKERSRGMDISFSSPLSTTRRVDKILLIMLHQQFALVLHAKQHGLIPSLPLASLLHSGIHACLCWRRAGVRVSAVMGTAVRVCFVMGSATRVWAIP